MPLTLEPKSKFVLSYHIDDPQDTTLYYVRSVIKDSITDTTLDTVDLTNVAVTAGNNRYTKTYEVPADPSGQGRFITVITKVYTNSGYTTLASQFGVDEKQYLVQTRWNISLGVGGHDISYNRIRELIREGLAEALGKIPKPEKSKEPDLKPVIEAIKRAENRIDDIHIPEQVKTDLKPVFDGLNAIRVAIKEIKIPEKVDLIPLLEEIIKINKSLLTQDNRIKDQMSAILKAFEKGIPMTMEQMSNLRELIGSHIPQKASIKDYFKGKI